jgi:hypothetical protein
MKKLATIIAATILLSPVANTAQAEQFIVTLEQPLSGNDGALRASLRLFEVDSFQHNQNYVVIFDVEDINALQAYFFAKQLKPLSVLSFPTAWSDAGVEAMVIEARMNILNSVECEFCEN